MKQCLTLFSLFLAVAVQASVLNDLMPRPKQVHPAEGIWMYDEARISVQPPATPLPSSEAYALKITPQGAILSASDERGVRYGKTTLKQLAALGKGQIPCAEISDWPTLGIRGVLHDTGRNWQPIAQLKQQLDVFADYKLNTFQWHITDNHGWRLQSKKYPQLSSAQNLDRTDKFYTQQEFKDLIAYASARGIMVIPELDVPGHTETFRRAFGAKRMDDARMRTIVSELFDELIALLDPKVTPYIHIGGDEVKSHERVPDEWLVGWIQQLEAKGFNVIAWAPGQYPKGLKRPLTRQYWTGRQVKRPNNEPYIDSMSSYYINHVDPLELLAPACYQMPCMTGPKENRLGALFAVWHDDAVSKPEDILTMNPVYPAIVLYSDSFWNGREKDQMKYYGNLPDPRDPDFAFAQELERRTLAQKVLFKGLPFDFYPQTQMRWRMAETSEEKPFDQLPWGERLLAQGTLYPQHFFFAQSNLTSGKTGCVWFGTIVHSDRNQTVELIADFMNYSRSEGRRRDRGLVINKWNDKGAQLWLNGIAIDPPRWKHPGLAGGASYETPMVDEVWMSRSPVKVRLEKGKNALLIKLPKSGWKWSATCFFPDPTGLTFEAPAVH
ncbi:MAG: family 20 glycosylhydrolase [Kiritimatiellia bacterium]